MIVIKKGKFAVIFTISVIITAIALIILKVYVLDEKKSQDVVESAIEYVDEDENTNDNDNSDSKNKKSKKKNENYEDSRVKKIKWGKFSDDTRAFIEIPGMLEYPVVQGKDNSYYLHRDLDKSYKYSGTLFINADNNANFTDDNTIIYGHNMTSGSMFGNLKRYKSKSYYQEHKYFYVYTRKTGSDPITGEKTDEKLKYEIKNVCIVNPVSKIYTIQFGDLNAKEEWLNSFHGLFGNELDLDKTICTLSTCTNLSRQRLCVQGSLISRKNFDNVEEK